MKRTCLLSLSVLCLIAAGRVAWGATPVILSVEIDRTARVYAPGEVRYGEKILVRASDADSADDIGCAIISDSASPPVTRSFVVCGGEGTKVNLTTVAFVWTKPETLAPPPSAPYYVEVRDGDGNRDTFVTSSPPPMPPVQLGLTAPVADSVIYTIPPTSYRPTFQWINSSAVTKIEVYEEGTWNLVWSKSIASGIHSVLYANGGTVNYGRTQLQPNHMYLWSLNTGTNTAVYTQPADPVTGGHGMTVRNWEEIHGRFAIYGGWGAVPLPPSLQGKVAYGNVTMTPITSARCYTSGVMGYQPDPYQRVWIGPELSDYPDWSPDGGKLLYSTPYGLRVDDLTGGPALGLSDPDPTAREGRWMPDAQRVVYSRRAESRSPGLPGDYDLWLARADGSEAQALVSGTEDEVFPAPSPEGLWIAYQRGLDPATATLRAVRRDGTDDHAIVATGVVGQDPTYAVTSLAQPAWSPDGTALVTAFRAQAGGLPALVGIGTLPVDGGPVTPLFLSPFWSCCGYPQAPMWSPDGQQVMFSSAHHLPSLTSYAIAGALELWLVNADGGLTPPVQLTNDFSMSRHLTWWGPNTLAGADAAFTCDGVTISFASVLADGVTRLLIPDEPRSPVPDGCVSVGPPLDLSTTAEYAGPITISIRAAALGLAPDADLSQYTLLQWEDGGWVNVATDGAPEVISGQCATLGEFLAVRALNTPPVSDFTAAPTSGVAPLMVSFTDASTGSPTTWSWDFGDGAVSDQQHPSHEYAAAGSYTVALTVGNAGGSDTCTKADLISVIVPPPAAAFTADLTTGLAPLTVQFADESTGDPTSWSWAFGDGGVSTEPSPSHTYLTPGAYSVTLVAANAGGAATESKAGYVTALMVPPTADFSVSPSSGLAPLTVAFTDASSGDPTAWSWDFGDGGGSSEQHQTHVYVSPGVYTVTLTASNEGGASVRVGADCVIAIVPAPVASFTLSPTSGDAPLAVQFTDVSANSPTSWWWDFGDGVTSTDQHPNHTYITGGSFTVSLTVANATGADTATVMQAVTTALPWTFVGPLSPINPDGSSVFKKKPFVQVRFQLLYPDGSAELSADAKLYVAPVAPDGSVGPYAPAVSNGGAGNSFVIQKKEYQFDLATRAMGAGVWSLRVVVSGAVASEFLVTLGK